MDDAERRAEGLLNDAWLQIPDGTHAFKRMEQAAIIALTELLRATPPAVSMAESISRTYTEACVRAYDTFRDGLDVEAYKANAHAKAASAIKAAWPEIIDALAPQPREDEA